MAKATCKDRHAVATQTADEDLPAESQLYKLPGEDEDYETCEGGPVQEKDTSRIFVGLESLPRQMIRSCVKKGFEFTLMVVGESGLGKSTLVNSLFLVDLYKDRLIPSTLESIAQTSYITKRTALIEEKGIKLRLTVVDTPGFGNAIDNRESWGPALNYTNKQFEAYLREETALNRKNLQDTRVHCCLYFISPFGHGLKPLDVACMRSLQQVVNIVPVVAKADCLTQAELQVKKARILAEMESHKIKIFPFHSEDGERQDLDLKRGVPFAVVGSNTTLERNGRVFRARVHHWGTVDVDSPAICDFGLLRRILVTNHMQDLKESTHNTHYENYRMKVHRESQCRKHTEKTNAHIDELRLIQMAHDSPIIKHVQFK